MHTHAGSKKLLQRDAEVSATKFVVQFSVGYRWGHFRDAINVFVERCEPLSS
jgi:hypothetical protein